MVAPFNPVPFSFCSLSQSLLHLHPHCWERNVKYFASNLPLLLGRSAVGRVEGEGWLAYLLFLQRDICLSGKRERKESKTTETWWAERTHHWFPPGIKQIVDNSCLCRTFFLSSLSSFIKLKFSGQLSACYQAVWGWQRAGEEVCVYPVIKLIGLSPARLRMIWTSPQPLCFSVCFTLSVTVLLLCSSSLFDLWTIIPSNRSPGHLAQEHELDKREWM